MKLNVYFGIAIRIIILFSVAMAATYLPEQLRGFFGDTPFVEGQGSYYRSPIDGDWNWGTRHYWFHWMMVLLFLLSLISTVMSIVRIIKDNYKID